MVTVAVTLCVATWGVPLARGAGLRVDFNHSSRHVSETLEPSFTPWSTSDSWLPRDTDTISNTFGSVTFTFARVGRFGASLTTSWWKESVADANSHTKLVNDGITVDRGEDGAQIELRISGLSEGTHTLLTYHNTWVNPAGRTFGPLNIYVDGVQAITNLPVSNRVTNDADAAVSYLQFDAAAGRDVVILFQADASDPYITHRNVCICGFELDAPDLIREGLRPVVVDQSRRPAATGDLHSLVDEEVRRPLTSIAKCLAEVRFRSSALAPVQVTGTVTLVDGERSLVVVQDESAAMGIFMPMTNAMLQPGQLLSIQGSGMLPYFRSFPDYPGRPSGQGYQYSFEGRTNVGNYYLARMRGYLHPPVSGQYTFWIAADDAAAVWLSPDCDPAKATKIASLRLGDSAGSREWNRHPTQESLVVKLRAGETYYIEAMAMHAVGPDWMAVAWQGPGMGRSVIDGRYLAPWEETSGSQSRAGAIAPTNGVLWDYWADFFVRRFSALRDRSSTESIVRIRDPRLQVLESGPLPSPRRMQLGELPRDEDDFQWSEIEGPVAFAAAAGNELELEFSGGESSVSARVFNWNGKSTAHLVNSRVRIQGVYEKIYNVQREVGGASMSVPDDRYLTVMGPGRGEESNPTSTMISEIEPSNPRMTWGRRLKVRGRVASAGSGEPLLLRGDDTFQALCSSDGIHWEQIGKPVEIGMSNSALVGLAVTSHDDFELATAAFDHVREPGSNWLSADISNRREGNFKVAGAAVTLTGSGRQIGQDGDQFFYVYQLLDGEGEIEARVRHLDAANAQAQAGLMIRGSLDPKSVHSAVLFSPAQGTRFQARKAFGEFPVEFALEPDKPWLKVVRRKNCLELRPVRTLGIELGQEVNVVGTLIWENGAPVLTDTFSVPFVGENVSHPEGARVLYDISIEELLAKAQRPSQPYRRGYLEVVGLRGVVTFCDRAMGVNRLFIQDGESEIPLLWADTNLTVSLRVGQLVRASGSTTVGRVPVALDTDSLDVLGWGTLPDAIPYSAGHFSVPSRHGQWVEVEGVVRAVRRDGVLNIMGREGMLSAWVGHQPAGGLKQYVDARVRVRGVFCSEDGLDSLLLVPSSRFLEIREAAPADPFAIPAFSVAQLAGLNVKPQALRRMKVSGVVTCVRVKEVFVQDDSGGLRARLLDQPSVKPGDQVEVVGFPNGHSSVILSEALVRKTGVGRLPSPVLILPEVRDEGEYANTLVRLEGVLIERRDTLGRWMWNVQAGPSVFEVMLIPAADEIGRLPNIAVGSRVATTGVYQLQRDQAVFGESGDENWSLVIPPRIWLRTPGDVVVLQRPPWWTWKHTTLVVGLVSCGLLATLVWVRTLRRRVAQRTRELQATTHRLEKETRTSAVLAERDRLAGEIHDSLEQGLTAIMLQLDSANKHVEKSPGARNILRIARNMAEFSRTEVQHAVWDLQSPLLANADLGVALKHMASQINSGSLEVNVDVIGSPCSLPSSHEHHLLRIAQEAINNAIKHARAQRINVALDYSGPDLKLTITDDGRGFLAAAVNEQGQSGHFGLHGIRARAKRIEAQLDISSQIGKGTIIMVQMKLKDAHAGIAFEKRELL